MSMSMSKSHNKQPFGQLVIGPPGSGKSTYSRALKHAFTQLGRPTVLVNLDPANDSTDSNDSTNTSIDIDIDIAHLISLQDAMDEFGLGPNGALVYCLEYLAANLDWLRHQLAPHLDQGSYFLFDLPGQVELFSHHSAIQSIIHLLTSRSANINMRLTVVQLMDAHHLLSPSSTLSNYKYLSAVLFVLQSMMHLELPQVNLLSKIDLAASQAHAYGHSLPLRLSAYTHPDDIHLLLPSTPPDDTSSSSSPLSSKLNKLNKELADFISDYALVEFLPFAVTDPMCLQAAITLVDKASGYAYGAIAGDVSVAALIDEVVEKYDAELRHHTSQLDADEHEHDFGSEGVSAQPGMEHLDQDMFDRWNRLQREVAVGKSGGASTGTIDKVGVKDIMERLV
ncbi:hypothetical protein BCR44DRAFT_1459228 [Catenaria anguillulae PL171]|uniref:GPN-loop GTPase 2 n=1 Tax=Catenaria anguillulae PL171 TaxID=765915 RepID=A0A1Y2HXF3_9FUNG|nr:hypothetical protein BCR44DRAFT_1459228 [Catenaria anguillulae PL171]